MNTRALVVRAERDPMPGVANPGTHQTYRHPTVGLDTRELGPLEPQHLRVEMRYAGICGTEVHLVESDPATGYTRCSAPASIPPEGRVLGHEGVGRVIDTGSQVRHISPGAYVAFESILVCQQCDVCRRGDFNQCVSSQLLGMQFDGLFQHIVDVPAALAHDIGRWDDTGDRDLRAAACLEPAGVAYVACENAHVGGGDSVAVFGGGPLGVLSAMLAKRVFGASTVYLVEPVPFRRDFARQWCDQVYDVEEFFSCPPGTVDVVIEASGVMDNVRRVFRRIGSNGRVVLLARRGAPLTLDAVDHQITNAISVAGSRGHMCGAFSRIIRLVQSGALPLDELVTGVADGLDELCALLQHTGPLYDRNCKVLVRLRP